MDRVMSKRLRASMRAANKGRNLRPRASQVPEPPPGFEDEPLAEAEAGETTAESPKTKPAASSDLRARETAREPVTATPAPPAPPKPPAVVSAPVEAPKAPSIEAAPSSDTQPSSPAFILGDEGKKKAATT